MTGMIGDKLSNRYEILRELGRGGMGVVYLGYDPTLEREVAIKMITPSTLTEEAIERFKREAKVVARMDHPAIVTIYDLGEHEGSLYYVMPYVPGTSLRPFLRDRSLTLGDVIDLGIQISEALEYSHQRGVVHRDIKPENIMVTREESEQIRTRITDFGLARVTTESRLTLSGALVGTVAYFSPEQVSGQELDGRSDVYSLATLLYECFVGETPFVGEISSVLYRILHEQPRSPLERGAEIHQELNDLLMQCLDKKPDHRLARAKDFADALLRYRGKLQEDEKGKQVLSSARPSSGPAPHPFVGRERELGELQRRLNAALAGECQFVVVSGEAGIGKTRLIDELETLVKVRKLRVLHGRFYEQDRAFPYQGFCEVIQEYYRVKASGSSSSSSQDFADLLPNLTELFPVLLETPEVRSSTAIPDLKQQNFLRIEDRTAVFELLARALIRIGNGKPLVLLFEDLHAADVSLEALQYLVRRLAATPTLIVGTYRSDEVDRHHPLSRMLATFQGDRRFVNIVLDRLSLSEHRSLIESLTSSVQMEEMIVRKLYESTEGNPYFTRELIRSLLDSGGLVRATDGALSFAETTLSGDILPETIQQTIQKRIDRLPDALREILTVAAVLGKSFEFRDLESLIGDKTGLEESIDDLVTGGFLEEDREARGDHLSFANGVLRDALYAELPRRRRKSLHRKHAEQLEKRNAERLDRVYPLLLHHYAQADVPGKVIDYGLKLARASLQTFGAEEAIRAARTVLDFLGEDEGSDPTIEGQARTLLGAAYRILGNGDSALKELRAAIRIFEQHKDTERYVATIVEAADTAWERRNVDETVHWIETGLAAARAAGKTQALLRLLSISAIVSNLQGEYEKARQLLAEMEALQPPQPKEDHVSAGGTLHVALANSVVATHPAAMRQDEEEEILTNVFEPLLKTDASGNLAPWLCERWESSDRGKTFTLTLREDVRLQDGTPLTAQEMKRSFESAIQTAWFSLPPVFAAIEGVMPFLQGSATDVKGLTLAGRFKLTITLEEPLPIYPALLADTRTSLVREVQDANKRTTHVIGSGPFFIKEFKPGKVVLARNPNYWRKPPALLDSIEFHTGLTTADIARGFRTRQFDLVRDILPEDLEDILRDRRLNAYVAEAPKKNVYFVLFNSRSEIGVVPEIRQALAGVTSPTDLVRSVLGRFAQPAEGLLPPGILGHDPGRRRSQLSRERVVELLQSSGRTPPIVCNASVHPIFQDRYSTLLQALLKLWSGIGIRINVVTPDMNSYLECAENNDGIDLMIGRYIADYDDPDNFTFGLFHSKAGHYRNYFSNRQLDEKLEEARLENRPDHRERLYRKFETQFLDHFYFLPLFHDIDFRVVNPKVQRLALRSNAPHVNYPEIGKLDTVSEPAVQKTRGGIIHVPITGDIQSLDPAKVFMVVESEVIPNIFETLTREVEGARVVPWLASEIKTEEGGKRYRFFLRQNVRFHDGRRVTARDVRHSFERLLQSSESKRKWLLSPIVGAKALLNGESTDLSGLQIVSSSEFTIELENPIVFFPALLTFVSTSILPEGSANFQENWKHGCAGTGPYRVVYFEPSRRLELEANPHYWRRDFPKNDGLTFYFQSSPAEILSEFRAGRFSLAWDLFPFEVESLRHDPEMGSKYQETPLLSTYYVVFNTKRGPLTNLKLRRQLIDSIEVDAIVKQHLGRLGIPANSLIPPGLLGYEPRHRKPSRTPQELSGDPIELTAIINSVYEGPYSALSSDLLSRFNQCGFHIRTVAETKSEYHKVLDSADVDLIVTRWVADYPDADTFVDNLLHSEKGIIGKVCGSPEMDHLIEKGRTEMDSLVRHAIYREIEEMIEQQAILLPLFHEQAYRFARPEVQGFDLSFSAPLIAYEKLWIKR